MSDRPLRLLVPDDDMGREVLALMDRAGLTVPPMAPGQIQSLCCSELITDRLGVGLEVIMLHPRDIPSYVWYGVADLGVASSAHLIESRAQIYRPYTFSFGQSPLVLAALQSHELSSLVRLQQLRVATNLRHFAREHFAARGWPVDMIPLHGSPSQAVMLGLADVALLSLDKPESLHSEGLAVVEQVGSSELKLLANRAASRLRRGMIERLVALLESADRPSE